MDLRLHTLYKVIYEDLVVNPPPPRYFYFLDLDPFAEYRKHGVVLFLDYWVSVSEDVKYWYKAFQKPYPDNFEIKVTIKETQLEMLLTHENPEFRDKAKELLKAKRPKPIIVLKEE